MTEKTSNVTSLVQRVKHLFAGITAGTMLLGISCATNPEKEEPARDRFLCKIGDYNRDVDGDGIRDKIWCTQKVIDGKTKYLIILEKGINDNSYENGIILEELSERPERYQGRRLLVFEH